MRVIFTEQQIKEVLGVDGSYLEPSSEDDGMPIANDEEVRTFDKTDIIPNDKIDAPCTDKIGKSISPSMYGIRRAYGSYGTGVKMCESNQELVGNNYSKNISPRIRNEWAKLAAANPDYQRLQYIANPDNEISYDEIRSIISDLNQFKKGNDPRYMKLGGDKTLSNLKSVKKQLENNSRTNKEINQRMGDENAFHSQQINKTYGTNKNVGNTNKHTTNYFTPSNN